MGDLLVPIAPAWECISEVIFGVLVASLIVLHYASPPRTNENKEKCIFNA